MINMFPVAENKERDNWVAANRHLLLSVDNVDVVLNDLWEYKKQSEYKLEEAEELKKKYAQTLKLKQWITVNRDVLKVARQFELQTTELNKQKKEVQELKKMLDFEMKRNDKIVKDIEDLALEHTDLHSDYGQDD